MSPQKIRSLLGDDAKGLSDSDLLIIYDELYLFLRTFLLTE